MLQSGFPLALKETVRSLTVNLPMETRNNVNILISENKVEYLVGTETICFPYRIYFIEPSEDIVLNLNELETIILHCIYSRSYDGFIREKHIRALLTKDIPHWAYPYIVKICDEYIVEILEVVYEELKDKQNDSIKMFCADNFQSFCKSYSRMISYWDIFYRDYCASFKNYIGRKLFIECFGAKKNTRRYHK